MSEKYRAAFARGKEDFQDGYDAGLNGRPIGCVSTQYDAGWLAGKDERARRIINTTTVPGRKGE